MPQTLLNTTDIDRLLARMAALIHADLLDTDRIALIGIRSRGEILAARLALCLSGHHGLTVDRGALDITLYRDDFNQPAAGRFVMQPTEINFSIDNRPIVLVDDVLHTGRSVRAALDALIDLGRPDLIRLAVLVDRGQHEFPIAADYVGKTLEVPSDRKVIVHLAESDDEDRVFLG